jgi:putative transposon-encoded protein
LFIEPGEYRTSELNRWPACSPKSRLTTSFLEHIMQHECMIHKESAMSNPATVSKMVKSIGASGQISLGKEFAGRQVLIESPAKGVWIIRTATITPDHEPWPEEIKALTRLKKSRTGKTPPPDQTSRKKSQA